MPKPTKSAHQRFNKIFKQNPQMMLICRTESSRAWEACKRAAMEAASGIG